MDLKQAIERVEYEMRRLDSEAYQGLHEALVIVVGAAKRCETIEQSETYKLGQEYQRCVEICNAFAAKYGEAINVAKERDICWLAGRLESQYALSKKIEKLEAQRAELREHVVHKLAHCGSYAKEFLTDFLKKLDAQDAAGGGE